MPPLMDQDVKMLQAPQASISDLFLRVSSTEIIHKKSFFTYIAAY
jgi:hypothetical protein